MYSPTLRLCPHFSSYSFGTAFVLILISLKPEFFKYTSNSSTEDAPVTQPQYRDSSAFISSVSSLIKTISEMAMRPPGFKTLYISS